MLLVGGKAVKDYYDTAFPSHPAVGPNVVLGTNQSSATLAVTFDSTHFNNSDSVSVQMIVNDSGGTGDSYDAKIAATVKNSASVYGNDTKDVGSLNQGRSRSANAQAQFAADNYTSFLYGTSGKTGILTVLPFLSAFYIYSHGSDKVQTQGTSFSSVICDCYAYSNSGFSVVLFAVDDPTGASSVTTKVSQKSIVTPPYNFVFIDGCEVNRNALMAQAFGITSISIDQVSLGWDTEVSDDQPNTDWVNRFMTDLGKGMTITDAKNDADRLGTPHYVNLSTAAFELAVFDPKGDTATKLHGVYGGNLTQWYK